MTSPTLNKLIGRTVVRDCDRERFVLVGFIKGKSRYGEAVNQPRFVLQGPGEMEARLCIPWDDFSLNYTFPLSV